MRELTIRAGIGTLSFTIVQDDGEEKVYPYPVKSNMSLSANLREAFKEQTYLINETKDREGKLIAKTTLMVTSPVVLIPEAEDEVDDDNSNFIYNELLPGHKGEAKKQIRIPELGVNTLFAVNNDLLLVVSDNCTDVKVNNVIIPVWKQLYKEYYKGNTPRQLFAYFHDKLIDICSFGQSRITFANSFDATHAHDALYYILYIWKQLGLSQEKDEMHIIGDVTNSEWLNNKLSAYIKNVFIH